MPDYKNGKIYKIVCYDTGEVYVGSTVQDLERRLKTHKSPVNGCCSKQIIDRNNYYIELLETYPCNNEFELNLKEGEYQRAIECINRRIAGRTDAEWRQDNIETIKAHGKEYYQDNKEKLKQYRINNADKRKQYCIDTKDKRRKRDSEEVNCSCGCVITKGYKSSHLKTKKHLNYVKSLTENQVIV